MECRFEYGFTRVKDLRALRCRQTSTGKLEVSQLEVDGQPVWPTPRFWKSFFMRYGINDCIFRYFEPAEVFERISSRVKEDALRFCLECKEGASPRLLAVSNPDRPIIREAEIRDIVSCHRSAETSYAAGIVTSTHVPGAGDRTFEIGGDRLQHRFVMETPVDGFGHPKIYVSFLRLVCSNGMIGYGRAFRSDVSLGKDIGHCIRRALETFDNGEGYAALRQRFESAQTSWASVWECVHLAKTLDKMRASGEARDSRLMSNLVAMTGDLNSIYGLANMDTLTPKRQRVLPARCRVYDLLNFASEVATHHATPAGNRTMQAHIGTLISDEYDLEGTAADSTEFADFFTSAESSKPRQQMLFN